MAQDDVDSAVVVQVAERDSASTMDTVKVRPAMFGQLLEPHVRRWLTLAAEVAQENGALRERGRGGGVAHDVTVADEDILGAVEVVVDEAGAEADEVQADRGNPGPA